MTRWELCEGTSVGRGLCDAWILIDIRVHGFRWLTGGGFEFTQKFSSGAAREEDLQGERQDETFHEQRVDGFG